MRIRLGDNSLEEVNCRRDPMQVTISGVNLVFTDSFIWRAVNIQRHEFSFLREDQG